MTAGPHVYGDGRVGLWIVSPSNLTHRLPLIAAFAGGQITDCFLPVTATAADLIKVRAQRRPDGTPLAAHVYAVSNHRPAAVLVQEVLSSLNRLSPGAAEVDIEEPDNVLRTYIREVHGGIRAAKPGLRLRINIAPYKGFALPPEAISHPNTYFAEQTYYGDMSRVSEAEALQDLLEHGVPIQKAACCYGAAAPLSPDDPHNLERIIALGTLWYRGSLVRPLRRGVIFQDDLMAEVGLL